MLSASNPVAREFDALAANYESNRLSAWYQAHSAAILAAMDPPPAGPLLDIGCASGYLLRRARRQFPDYAAMGIDISTAMIAAARQNAADEGLQRLEFMVGDWERLDAVNRRQLRSMAIDTVVCASVLHYFLDPHQALRGMYNLLEPGGTLYLLERDKSRSALTFVWDYLHRHWIKDQVEFYSIEVLRDILARAGFTDIKVVRSIRKYLWKGKLYTSVVLLKARKA